MSIYRRVFRYYRPFLPQTVAGLLLSLIGIGLNLLKPWPLKVIVDNVIPKFSLGGHVRFLGFGGNWMHDPKTIVLVLRLALVVIQFLWGVANWATNYILVKVGLRALLKLRTDLYAYLP